MKGLKAIMLFLKVIKSKKKVKMVEAFGVSKRQACTKESVKQNSVKG